MTDRKLYRVRPGMRYGARNDLLEGDTVELTEREAAPVLDKLELVAAVEPETVVVQNDLPQNPLFWQLSSALVDTLTNFGYVTDDSIQEASDEALLDLPGIGPAALDKIRSLYEG